MNFVRRIAFWAIISRCMFLFNYNIMGKIDKILNNFLSDNKLLNTASFCNAKSNKYMYGMHGVSIPSQLTQDVVQLKETVCPDLAENLLLQRRRINHRSVTGYSDSIDEFLFRIKKEFLAENNQIKTNIKNRLPIDTISSSSTRNRIRDLDAVIAQSEIPQDIVLYRGGSPWDFGFSGASSKEFLDKFYKQGRSFQIPTFLEASLDKQVAESFADGKILYKINVPRGTKGVYMENLSLSKNSAECVNWCNEEEILLPRNLVARYKDRIKTDAYEIVEIDLIPENSLMEKVSRFWENGVL